MELFIEVTVDIVANTPPQPPQQQQAGQRAHRARVYQQVAARKAASSSEAEKAIWQYFETLTGANPFPPTASSWVSGTILHYH